MDASEEVTKVIQEYVDACSLGSVERLRAIFHPQALMSGYLAGQLLTGSPEPFFQAVEAQPAPAENGTDYRTEIRCVDVAGDVATAALDEHGYLGMDFTNFFHLVKISGTWKIVSKTFTSR